MKRCSRCGITKPLDQFVADRSRASGRMPRCRDCHSAQMRADRAGRPEQIREMRKTWNRNRKDEDSVWKSADRISNPGKYWAQSLKTAHGMQPEQWFAMFAEQDGNCYLCERPLPEERGKVAIDHDHGHCPPGKSCGRCRRGLAHHQCNAGMGFLGDDPELMRRAADNLERAKEMTAALLMTAPTQDALIPLEELA